MLVTTSRHHPIQLSSASLSSLITRLLLLGPFSATCSNIYFSSNRCRPVSAAKMSTVAIPQQHTLHSPSLQHPDSPDNASDSETPASSRKSSRSASRSSRRSKESTRQQPGLQRMSGYFPLGYKEAAYQWVCSLSLFHLSKPWSLRATRLTSTSFPGHIVDQRIASHLRAQCPKTDPLPQRGRLRCSLLRLAKYRRQARSLRQPCMALRHGAPLGQEQGPERVLGRARR